MRKLERKSMGRRTEVGGRNAEVGKEKHGAEGREHKAKGIFSDNMMSETEGFLPEADQCSGVSAASGRERPV